MNARTPDHVLSTASSLANGDRTRTTLHLLKALSTHEGDSDLGLLADAILSAGGFYQRNSEELDRALDAAFQVRVLGDRLADEYEAQIANAMERT